MMDRRLKGQLDLIDEMLAGPGGEKLWDVLTALRGPDEAKKDVLKSGTTVVIRKLAFPKTANSARPRSAAESATFVSRCTKPTGLYDNDSGDHFSEHIRHAWKALTGRPYHYLDDPPEFGSEPRIHRVDDGTLDTVLKCRECGEEFRMQYDPDDATSNDPPEVQRESYETWVKEQIAEMEEEHECGDED